MRHWPSDRLSGSQLRSMRIDLQWTVRKLSIQSGIHRSTISKIEAGKSEGEPETLRALLYTLDVAGAALPQRRAPVSGAPISSIDPLIAALRAPIADAHAVGAV